MAEPAQIKAGLLDNTVPILLCAACVGLAGLFVQVAKLEATMNRAVTDISEIKKDSESRIDDLEDRVRSLEIKVR